ncbi:MAG: hypothetical protein K0B10_03850, partial [Vicingaceae bacterium]|nr:hypothetical protein [Vicingaceae bacterium]
MYPDQQWPPSYYWGVPQMTVLDFSYPNPINPVVTYGGDAPFIPFPLQWNMSFSGINQYAATKIRDDGSRWLFININGKIVTVQIDGNGVNLLTFSTVPLLVTAAGTHIIRGEMEVVEYLDPITNQKRYKLALLGQYNYDPSLYVAEIDYNTGNLIPSSEKTYSYTFGTELKGVEFSPDLNYVYVTQDLPFGNNIPVIPSIDYFDLSQPTLIKQGLNVPNTYDFRKSQIELGKDGKLYFASNNRLATLNNPNNPTTPIFVDNAIPIVYNSNQSFLGHTFLETFILPDQIDGMDYTASFNSSVACCLSFTEFEVKNQKQNTEYIGSQTWSPGSNPFNNTNNPVTVEEQLVIKQGANIIINNMQFEFASDAKLIVENGARLTINNTTLTVNYECNPNAMWQGVEVWGTGTGSNQVNTSGWFTANNSLIEHALEGAVNFRQPVATSGGTTVPPVNANNGGIIRATNTTFRNNLVDVAFNPYESVFNGNSINDISRFINVTFETDNSLNNPALNGGMVHARLIGVNGINFSGCDFKNTAPQGIFTFLGRGLGIRSANSKIVVTARCLNLTNPCTNLDKSLFENLTGGIRASSSNPTYTVRVTQSEFKNNWRSILLSGLTVPEVTDNHFEVGESFNNLITPTTVSYGLYLSQCTRYKVENNTFVSPIFPTINDAYLGIYAFQSGENSNEIYRNTFTDLKVGIQAAGINAGTSPLAIRQRGLEFRCNKFFETANFDILVSSGRVKILQGLCSLNPTTPANNFFSNTVVSGGGDFWMENNVTLNSIYSFSDNNSTLEPRNGFYNTNNTTLNLCLSPSPKFLNDETSCPKRVTRTRAQLTTALGGLKLTIDSLTGLIDAGSTAALLNIIATQSGGNVNNALLAASPYLSDDVLLAFLATNPANGHIQQILLANSPLSDAVAAYLAGMTLPKGIKNQLTNAQTGESAMELLQQEISVYQSEFQRTENDLIRDLLFDEVTSDGFALVEDYLLQQPTKTNEQEQLLALVRMANQDSVAARQQLDALDVNPVNEDFCKLHNVVVDVMSTAACTFTLVTDTARATLVGEVADATTNQQEVANAQALLENVGIRNPYNEVIEIVAPQPGNNLR